MDGLIDPACCPECGNDPSVWFFHEPEWAVKFNRFGIAVATGTLLTQLFLILSPKDWLFELLLKERSYYTPWGFQGAISNVHHDETTMGIASFLFLIVFIPTTHQVRSHRSLILFCIIAAIATISFFAAGSV